MWILLLGLTSGLLASSWANSDKEVTSLSCSYMGVFQIQGKGRYSLSFEEAQTACEKLGATLASEEEVTKGYENGLETCRYGWISDGNITIPRLTANSVCAQNQTGIITIKPPEDRYDAYCYDHKDISIKNCKFKIETSAVMTELEKNGTATNMHFGDDQDNSTFPLSKNTEVLTEADGLTPDMYDSISFALSEKNITTPPISCEHKGCLTSVRPTDSPQKDTANSFNLSETKEEAETTEKPTTTNPVLDPFGSGMGEPTQMYDPKLSMVEDATSETEWAGRPNEETRRDEAAVTESYTTTDVLVKTNQSMQPRGRIVLPPSEGKQSSTTSAEWMIIVGSIVAVIAILIACVFAVMSRKRFCGKHKSLTITSTSNSEGNGKAASAASSRAQEREQEMVTLMNKEKIQENGNTEEFTVITLEESPEKNQEA